MSVHVQYDTKLHQQSAPDTGDGYDPTVPETTGNGFSAIFGQSGTSTNTTGNTYTTAYLYFVCFIASHMPKLCHSIYYRFETPVCNTLIHY
jgi:hypothetical protein